MEGDYPQQYYDFIRLFNEGEYYECHDLLEELWLEDRHNRFLQGMLQMAVGIYHYEYGNVKGARLMFKSALGYLEKYRPKFWGLDLEAVHHNIKHMLNYLPQEDKISLEEAQNRPLPTLVLVLEQ